MCSTRLIRRLPARDSRCRCCWPEEASSGAVPFQDAKWSRLANLWMSPGVGEQPGRARRADAVQLQQRGTLSFDQDGDFFLARLDLLVGALELGDQLGGEPAPGLPGGVTRPDRGDQCPRLGSGQELLRPAGKQYPAAADGSG